MTESEWLCCGDPRVMLDHVRERAGARQLRLFACACLRAVWRHLFDERSRQAVLVAERYADGQASAADLASAEAAAFEVARVADFRSTVSDPGWAASHAAHRAANYDPYSAASGAVFIAALCAAPWLYEPSGAVLHHGDVAAKARARQHHCDLLRDVVGNPFRRVTVRPEWLAWDRGVVVRLAEHIYRESSFDELPVLGDALEEAGCRDETLLTHCRSAGVHVRGCWLVDRILARQ
jgi:hypothetical protein